MALKMTHKGVMPCCVSFLVARNTHDSLLSQRKIICGTKYHNVTMPDTKVLVEVRQVNFFYCLTHFKVAKCSSNMPKFLRKFNSSSESKQAKTKMLELPLIKLAGVFCLTRQLLNQLPWLNLQIFNNNHLFLSQGVLFFQENDTSPVFTENKFFQCTMAHKVVNSDVAGKKILVCKLYFAIECEESSVWATFRSVTTAFRIGKDNRMLNAQVSCKFSFAVFHIKM